MSLMSSIINLIERGYVPDSVTRAGIRRLLSKRLAKLPKLGTVAFDRHRREFLSTMDEGAIAEVPELANEQHYEVPAEFFRLALGTRLKYSCCYYESDDARLDDAEAAALKLSCEHAQLENGQEILELGCGWGSLSLWMAERYPESRITSVSNSHSQREFIERTARERGLQNLTVITSDMNDFRTEQQFDRVVSVEMFEHMRNQAQLLSRIAGWLKPEGKLFVHIFCHHAIPYFFQEDGDADWMARYFFSGGMMPSHDLFSRLESPLRISSSWEWDGRHYEKTSNDWLANMDQHRDRILELFRETYGEKDAIRWWNRWRMFFMACAELFGYRDGREWRVSHYLFQHQQSPSSSVSHSPDYEAVS